MLCDMCGVTSFAALDFVYAVIGLYVQQMRNKSSELFKISKVRLWNVCCYTADRSTPFHSSLSLGGFVCPWSYNALAVNILTFYTNLYLIHPFFISA
jgi:hypothetical protein